MDLAWVEGKLTAFPVLQVVQNGSQLSARYAEDYLLDCKGDGVDCGTDASSFVQYVKERRPP